MPARPHLILVRERDAQFAASGCGGRIDGDACRWTRAGESVFAERRRLMERTGAVYRAVRERFGDRVEISVVDPRNAVALAFLVLRDAMRFAVRPRRLARTLLRIGAVAVIVDGEVLASGRVPEIDDVLRRLEHAMATHSRPRPTHA